jgi:hypothetical protein
MYIVHVCLEKVILIWCKILFNSIIKNVLLGITSTDYVRMKKYGESFDAIDHVKFWLFPTGLKTLVAQFEVFTSADLVLLTSNFG